MKGNLTVPEQLSRMSRGMQIRIGMMMMMMMMMMTNMVDEVFEDESDED